MTFLARSLTPDHQASPVEQLMYVSGRLCLKNLDVLYNYSHIGTAGREA